MHALVRGTSLTCGPCGFMRACMAGGYLPAGNPLSLPGDRIRSYGEMAGLRVTNCASPDKGKQSCGRGDLAMRTSLRARQTRLSIVASELPSLGEASTAAQTPSEPTKSPEALVRRQRWRTAPRGVKVPSHTLTRLEEVTETAEISESCAYLLDLRRVALGIGSLGRLTSRYFVSLESGHERLVS